MNLPTLSHAVSTCLKNPMFREEGDTREYISVPRETVEALKEAGELVLRAAGVNSTNENERKAA